MHHRRDNEHSDLIEINGALGGGGQVLRSALTLSMLTGKPTRVFNIRTDRKHSGLLRQHLTAVRAATQITQARTEGAEIGSQEVYFAPGAIQAGNYQFSIGSAGNCALVLQTVLPALWFADAPSTVCVMGGTHNREAPPFDFLQTSWLPLVRRMGFHTELELHCYGFFPAGGGEIFARTVPAVAADLRPTDVRVRGPLLRVHAQALVANLSVMIAQRELEQIQAEFAQAECEMCAITMAQGPGNALTLTVEHEALTEVFTSFGEKGIPAEDVAKGVVEQARRYMETQAAVAEHLADQLLIPMALAGGGSFSTTRITQHMMTNASVIEAFLPIKIVAQAEKTHAVVLVQPRESAPE